MSEKTLLTRSMLSLRFLFRAGAQALVNRSRRYLKRARNRRFDLARKILNRFGFDIRRTNFRDMAISTKIPGGLAFTKNARQNDAKAGSIREICLVYLCVGSQNIIFLENSVNSARNSGFSGAIRVYFDGATVSELQAAVGRFNTELVPLSRISSNELTGADSFGTPDFSRITHAKWRVILDTLKETGSIVVFSDTDVVYLRNFVSFINDATQHFSMGIQSEARAMFPPNYCIGLMYFTPESTSFLEQISEITFANASRGTAQQIFNEVIAGNPRFVTEILTLPESVFPVGLSYPLVGGEKHPCQVHESEIVAFHANWVNGYPNKKKMLMDLGLWNVKETRD